MLLLYQLCVFVSVEIKRMENASCSSSFTAVVSQSVQKSLRVKWKLNTSSIFNLKAFVTVAILESTSTETKTQAGQQNSIYVQRVTMWIKLQVQLSAV